MHPTTHTHTHAPKTNQSSSTTMEIVALTPYACKDANTPVTMQACAPALIATMSSEMRSNRSHTHAHTHSRTQHTRNTNPGPVVLTRCRPEPREIHPFRKPDASRPASRLQPPNGANYRRRDCVPWIICWTRSVGTPPAAAPDRCLRRWALVNRGIQTSASCVCVCAVGGWVES